MNNLEKKIDLLVKIALEESDENRESLKKSLALLHLQSDSTEGNAPRSVEHIVDEMLGELGVPANLEGFDALALALLMVVQTPSLRHSITGRLYPKVAQLLDKTPAQVERVMHHAIEVAWTRGDMDVFRKYFGNSIHPEKGKPTNSEFISQISHYIRTRCMEQE